MQILTKYILGVTAVVFLLVGVSLLIQRPVSGDSCSGVVGTTYMTTIQSGKVSEPNIKAKLCDKIMFMNDDHVTREIAFGPHEDHVPYDGVAERFLNQGQYFTIALNKAGYYHWHDHNHDAVGGYFKVSK